MTIASKLETINEALGDIKSSIVAKGVTPTGNITTFSTAIESISTGDEITATNTTGSAVSADDKVWVEPEINYTQNFSIGGNPAINNFTLTSTDYPNRSGIVYNMINPPVPQESVEVQLKGYINYNTSANYPNADTGYGDFSIYCKAPGSGGFPYESALSLFLGDGLTIQTNKGANTYTILPRTSLVKDQMYWFKVLVTDSQIVASYSTDGSSWINTTLSASSLLAAFTNTYIGMSTATSEGYGTYDLLECYVKVDGNTVWTPYLASTTYSIINDTDITSTSFTGIAQSNIANNATGSVKTLLDGNGTYAPTTTTKTITTNGTYTASAENAYGLSEVTVDVPTPDIWYNWRTDATYSSKIVTGTNLSIATNLAYGKGLYVASVYNSSSYFTSEDGVTWEERSLGNTRYWATVKFVNNKFFITTVYSSNILAYSDDGLSWTEVTLPQGAYWRDIAYGNGTYVLVAENLSGKSLYSTDLQTWNEMTISPSTDSVAWYGVCYANGKFVAVGGGGYGNYNTIRYSTDGINWVKGQYDSSVSTTYRSLSYITYANNKFIAVSGDSYNYCFLSNDGTNWVQQSLPDTVSSTGIATDGINVVIFTNSSSNNLLYSQNLVNWSSESKNSISYYGCYGDGKFLATLYNSTNKWFGEFSQSQCYTLTASPTTSTQVYEIPKKTSALTITTVGTGTITLSDTKVYNRNLAGDVQSPVLGTKTITSNGTYTAASDYLDGFSSVTVDVPSAPTKKYNLLDRVKDDSNNEIGTVSGFFTDANNVEYAVVCLDAQYRLASGKILDTVANFNSPAYPNAYLALDAKETATYNTQRILNAGVSEACSHCRSKSFTIDGTTYYGQLPNFKELLDIFGNRTTINDIDGTATSYTSLALPTTVTYWSSTKYSGSGNSYCYVWDTRDTGMGSSAVGYGEFVIPVLEIPNT